jgi:hypothetical protein
MAVHDRLDLGMDLVDLAVDKSFEINSPAFGSIALQRRTYSGRPSSSMRLDE